VAEADSETMIGTGQEITVAFRSAKDAAFAKRKATMRQSLIRHSLLDFSICANRLGAVEEDIRSDRSAGGLS
jgi:hypothetical protein